MTNKYSSAIKNNFDAVRLSKENWKQVLEWLKSMNIRANETRDNLIEVSCNRSLERCHIGDWIVVTEAGRSAVMNNEAFILFFSPAEKEQEDEQPHSENTCMHLRQSRYNPLDAGYCMDCGELF